MNDQTIGIRDLTVNYEAQLGQANGMSKFVPFRIHPELKNPDSFPPRHTGTKLVYAHFFRVESGYTLRDLPKYMEDRIMRGPIDLREIYALGDVITEEKCEFAIYAPEFTSRNDAILKVHKYPGWEGLGLTISGFDETEESPYDFKWIGFSTGE